MQGLHLTADSHHYRCVPKWLLDAAQFVPSCLQAVRACGLSPLQRLFHTSPATPLGAGGVTATMLLAESHLCVHAWPEPNAVTLDVYICKFGADHSARSHALMNTLLTLFDAILVTRHALQRGEVCATASERSNA